MKNLRIQRALLSVTNKDGIVEFAQFLHDNGVSLLSTGGTERALAGAGLPVVPVSEVTGFPEILDGRVKTLHPHVHGGILADKDNPAHLKTLEERGIEPIDLVCVNLYNFGKAVKKAFSPRDAVEQIDIGGPCLLRAAAKNFNSVLVVPGVEYYKKIISHLKKHEMHATLRLRRNMARFTFDRTSTYDAVIASFMATW